MRQCCTALFALITSVQALASAPVDVAKQQFAAEDYVATIGTVDAALTPRQALNLTAQARYDLLMLKAESLLQLQRKDLAIADFRAAQENAPDLPRAAVANANALVISASNGVAYKMVGDVKAEPVNVLNRDSRKTAMKALLVDMQPRVQREYDAALRATTLPALERAYESLFDMYCLQYTAELESKATLESMAMLSEHARELIRGEIAGLRDNVLLLERSADTYDAIANSRRGLNSTQRRDLVATQQYLQQIYDRAVVYRRISQRFEGRGEPWGTVLAEVADLGSRINFLLRADRMG